MRYVSTRRSPGELRLPRQILFLTLLGHFWLATAHSLHAGADSLIAPEKNMRPPATEHWESCMSRAAEGNFSLEDCGRPTLQKTRPLQRKTSENGLFSLYGSGNLLFFRTKSQETGLITESFIAGPHSQLREVSELTLDTQHSEIFVRDRSQPSKILVYRLAEGRADRAPHRKIEDPSFSQIADLAVAAEANLLLAPHPEDSSVLLIHRDANHRHPQAEMRKAIRGKIQGPKTGLISPVSVVYDSERKEILVADSAAQKILVFGVEDSGDVAPREVLPLEAPAIGIGLLHSARVLQIITRDPSGRTQVEEFQRDSDLKKGA